MRFLLPAALAVALMSGSAEASTFYSGNTLFDRCSTAATQGDCRGYVMGVADAMDGAQSADGSLIMCIPAGVADTQLKDIVMRDLRGHPERRHSRADGIVASALATAFPCR